MHQRGPNYTAFPLSFLPNVRLNRNQMKGGSSQLRQQLLGHHDVGHELPKRHDIDQISHVAQLEQVIKDGYYMKSTIDRMDLNESKKKKLTQPLRPFGSLIRPLMTQKDQNILNF